MKQGWEILPFENCIKKVKYTAKIASSDYLTTGAYPIISQEEEMISGYWDKKEDVFAVSSPVVIFGDHTRVLKYVDFDFVLGADGVKILQPIDCLDAKFLMYFLKSCKIPSLGYSRHYKLLKEISVPVPERAEQERIVGELDCLSGIIAAKRAQLRELDTLAQSIFYTMFGDPITNDKGWQTKKLGEITEQINGLWVGKNPPFVTIAVIRNTNFTKDCNLDTNNIAYIQVEQKQYSTRKLKCGDIIIEKSGGSDKQPVGRPILFNIEDGEYSFSNFTSVLRVVDNTLISSKFLHKFLVYIYNQGYTLNMQSKTTGIRNLNFKLYKNMNVPIPPIALQNEFAEKIENIERQKELITKSIKETEDLFNSRMDYYFN